MAFFWLGANGTNLGVFEALDEETARRDFAREFDWPDTDEVDVERLELQLYRVSEGDVELADPDTAWDVEQSVLVAAHNERQALEAARAYDAKRLDSDNHIVDGRPVVCVRADDATGDWRTAR